MSNGQNINEIYKDAVNYRIGKNYLKSDSLFKIVLKKQKKNLPEDLCYHYGVVLYALNNKKQAEQFFTKYLKLSPQNQLFKDSSVYYLGLIGLKTSTGVPKTVTVHLCDQCNGEGKFMQDCSRCHATAKVLCYRCKGNGVVNAGAEIGNSKFLKCSVCKGNGSLICEYCKGNKRVFEKCGKCKGAGKITKIE